MLLYKNMRRNAYAINIRFRLKKFHFTSSDNVVQIELRKNTELKSFITGAIHL